MSLVPKWQHPNWMFRGVTDSSFSLVPKIGRSEFRPHYSAALEKVAFDRFKALSVPHVEIAPTDELGWLCLGQHHGLPTRLLDWTSSPLVALFFAVERRAPLKPFEHEVAVYGTTQAPDVHINHPNPFSIGEVSLVFPTHVSARMAAQSALLTIHPVPYEPYSPDALIKMLIAPKVASDLLTNLRLCGIHRASMFPSLDGVADYISYSYRLWEDANEAHDPNKTIKSLLAPDGTAAS